MVVGGGITAVMALSMGLRHGLDADHLAVVDALVRQRATEQRSAVAWTGVLFALGHVGVILLVSVALSVLPTSLDLPAWLGVAGSVISAATLLVLGVLNVRAAVSAPPSVGAPLIGLRSRLFAFRRTGGSAWHVLGIGALFAVSFDAVAIAALFAGTSSQASAATAAASLFSLGMLSVSAANGLWVARVLRELADARRAAGRLMALTIGLSSLSVGTWILLRMFGGSLSSYLEVSDLSMSLIVIGIVAVGYGSALVLARRTGHPAAVSIGAATGVLRG